MELTLMPLLVVDIVGGAVAAVIAQSKGRNAVGYFFLGVLLPIVGIIIAAAMRPNAPVLEDRELATGDRRRCPYCAEVIRSEAKVCRYCARSLADDEVAGVVLRESWYTPERPR
jgi:ribosomal protein S14